MSTHHMCNAHPLHVLKGNKAEGWSWSIVPLVGCHSCPLHGRNMYYILSVKGPLNVYRLLYKFQVDGLLMHSDMHMVMKLECRENGIIGRNKKIVMAYIL